jgi:hypothetical protein
MCFLIWVFISDPKGLISSFETFKELP